MSRPDPYQVLGVAPTADGGAIRSAYLQLMKRYHPDQNRSAEAAERAKEVSAAYAVVGDSKRRTHYDRRWQLSDPPSSAVPPLPHKTARGRAGGLLLVVLSGGLVAFAVLRPPAAVPGDGAQAVAELQPVPPVAASAPAIADRAAREVPVTPQPTAPAPQVVALPLVVEPALPVAPAAPGSERALPIAPQPPAPTATPPADRCDVEGSCRSIDLAALERHLDLLTDQSLASADEAKRRLLLGTGEAFLARITRCTSATCKRDNYLARNREIAEIMRG